VAVALLDGEVTPAQYIPQRIVRQDVQDLLRKVTIQPNADMSQRFPAEMPCRIQITLNNGQTFSREKQDYEGFHTHPFSWEQITAKFESLASPFTTAAQRTAIIDIVAELETKDVAQLTEAVNAPFEGAHQ
jgi:2-methylcitrate dehydratase